MSRNLTSKTELCGNCKHFVAGGLCELVQGQIKAKDTCDLFARGSPKPMETEVEPKYLKTDVNYKPGFMVETLSGDIAQKAIQMEHFLLSRGVSENESHRAAVDYFSQPEPPYAMPWPGPVTGLDLAGRIDPVIVPDTGTPNMSFRGLPKDTQPYPTSNVSPYGIGSNESYPANPTPDPNSIGSLSNEYNIYNPPYPYTSTVWDGLASDVNSQPSMHNEYGFNVAKSIPEWRYPVEQSQMYPIRIPDVIIPPSGQFNETRREDEKKKLHKLLAKWALLLGGIIAIDQLIKNYLDSETDKPLEVFAEYQYHGHDSDDECEKFGGKTFDLLETHSRPVIPSENIGYTTTHPNCICTWKVLSNYKGTGNSLTRKEESDIHSIESHISKAAKKGDLHTVNKDGKLSSKTTSKNPLKELCDCMNVSIPSLHLDLSPRAKIGRKILRRTALQEQISNLRSEFGWLTDDYLDRAKELAEDAEGQLYLIRAAGESITDHRAEGEPYRRKLSSDELNSMTRTIIGKSMDINHQPEFETDATILDAEFDKNRKEIQTLVIERDPQIIDAIEDGKITAVSINGGMPRSESVEKCNHGCDGDSCELCVVPHGVVLGESDGIGMTWVITDPGGLYWNGHFVPSAEPGIKFTKIETL